MRMGYEVYLQKLLDIFALKNICMIKRIVIGEVETSEYKEDSNKHTQAKCISLIILR